MTLAVTHLWRLLRAGLTLARHDALLQPEQIALLPAPARLALKAANLGRKAPQGDAQSRVSSALAKLGPSYIKLGQFLATRPDIVGAKRAFELRALQDRLPPFSMTEARRAVEANLGGQLEDHFSSFSEPVAAASIAQVHRARTADGRDVAVKILRPGVDRRFASDTQSFYLAARLIERFVPAARRLRPVAAVETLDHSMKLELDLRMEASAMSEMAANTKDDPGFRVPQVDWQRTGKEVLTLQWIDGTPMSDVAALKARGLDLVTLGDLVIQSFLRHAIRDGFFHADMHQGNLFVDREGKLVPVDYGIMGRLGVKERLFLAEILYGFIVRDYARVSRVHFEANYVPAHQSMDDFAQALRAIGEPIMDKPAEEISMARLLTQLFEVTAQFDMVMQPQLILLQKTMVVVEGVARTLNPALNMWKTAEPVVSEFIARKLGPIGKVEGAVEGALQMGSVIAGLPEMLSEAQRATTMLADMAKEGGVKLDRETLSALAAEQARRTRFGRYALIAGAAALAVIALNLAT